MLSLVAYGNSDDSGSDSDTESSNVGNVPAEDVQVPDVQTNVSAKEADSSSKLASTIITGDEHTRSVPKEPGKLTSLPSSLKTSINFDLKILDKNRSQPIRITIPSLKELEKDEEPDRKPKLKPSTKGSGLFSLLPEPKNSTSSVSKGLVPQSVAKIKTTKPKKLVPQKVTKKHKSKIHDEDDDDEEDEGKPLNSFFFPSHDDVPLPPVDLYLDAPMTPSDVTSSTSISAPVGLDSSIQPPTDMIYPSSVNSPQVTSTQSDTDEIEEPSLDSAALLKLCGARGRRKGPDLSEIIDVSGSSLIGDNSLQLAKELSKEQPTHSFKRKSECSTLQRRKHQITYLAEQAKAQELELRNNWAQNRMTRKQTQAKYGF